ncbi:MAG: glycoside hydrolase family 3 N-terminal domain-containing protein [Myxococcota bacterium]
MSAPPYRDPSLDVASRVADLLGRMTLDEKLAQLGGVWSTQLVEGEAFSEERARSLLRHGTGHVTRIGAATGLRPAESAAFANRIQRFLRDETRLGIPAIVHEEAVAGLCARDATQFPQAIGLAATWDPDRLERVAQVIRSQMLAVGARQALSPVLDVARDPRWGRTEETYGEDPYLASRMGVAYVRGLQGPDLARGVAATGKHFLGYGFSEGGLNHAPVHLGPRELREVFARPFEAAIREADLASVMNAYNEVDGLPCGGSREILDDLLRGELGFGGVVVADYFTLRLLESFHHVAADRGEAAALALEAGIDVELPQLDCYGAPLREQLEAGRLPMALVDRALARVLELKLRLGLFESCEVDEVRASTLFDTREQRLLAREVAARSFVLLRNVGALLPLDPSLATLAVLGPCADDPRLLQGDYSYPAHAEIVYRGLSVGGDADGGADRGIAPAPDQSAFRPGPYFVPMVTPLEGIRAAVSPTTTILSARGASISDPETGEIAEAVAAAREAAVAIVFVGGRSGLLPDCTSGEFRDRASLGLPGAQQALVQAVVETGTPTVVVLIHGRPLALPWIASHVPAVLEAWLPGEEAGHALADVLFGRVSPSGRLPVSLPRDVGQVPVYYDHKSGGGRSQMLGDYVDLSTRPLFAFGHGLGYTRFEYGALELSEDQPRADQPVRIALDVSNVSERAGEEVVQLYLRDVVASITRPVQQLAGFARVPLAPGQTRRVSFELDLSALAFPDRSLRWCIEPGEVEVQVGSSSTDIRQRASFEITGPARRLEGAEMRPSSVRID